MDTISKPCEVIPAMSSPEGGMAAAEEEPTEEQEALEEPNDMDTEVEFGPVNDEKYYSHGAAYWSQVPPTVDGMLGGFGYISHTDIQGSETFIKSIYKVRNKSFLN